MKNKLLELVGEVTYRKGVEYYVDKKVNAVQQISNDEYEAVVTGESIYNVILNIKDISLSTCTCPFFNDGNKVCKHIIAVYISLHPDIAKEDIELYQSLKPSRPRKIKVMKPKPVSKEPELVEQEVVEERVRKKHVPVEPISKDVFIDDVYDDQPIKYQPYYVGQRLSELRRAKKITRFKLAEEMGVEKQDIEMWEAGRNLPNIDDLEYMAYTLLDSSIEYLLFGQDDYFEQEVMDEEVEEDEPEEAPNAEPVTTPKPVVTNTAPPQRTSPKASKAILTVFKVFVALCYVPIWFIVGLVTLFSLLPAPWNLFRNVKDYPEEHNWDPNYTDQEFYDMVDDD